MSKKCIAETNDRKKENERNLIKEQKPGENKLSRFCCKAISLGGFHI